MTRAMYLSAVVSLLAAAPAIAAGPSSPVGRWLTEGGRAIVEVHPCGPALCGTLRRVLQPDPGTPQTDVHNPDPARRGQRTDGLTILRGFVAEDGRWHGSAYDPRSGRSYNAFITVPSDGTLALRGCVWRLCQTQVWHRAP